MRYAPGCLQAGRSDEGIFFQHSGGHTLLGTNSSRSSTWMFVLRQGVEPRRAKRTSLESLFERIESKGPH